MKKIYMEEKLENTVKVGYSAAVRFIGISLKSSGKVRGFLKVKNYSPEETDWIIDQLEEQGYIDDLRIAKSIIKSRQGRKAEAWPCLKIRMHARLLSQKAIEQSYECYPGDDVLLSSLVQFKIKPDFFKLVEREENFDVKAWKQKTIRYILGKGFSLGLIQAELDTMLRDIY